MPDRERKVKRVLVMLQYEGSADPNEGEIFDLTALSQEASASKGGKFQDASIELRVNTSKDYGADWTGGVAPTKTTASWNVSVDFSGSGWTAHLDDAINASLPDSFATQDLRKKLERMQKKEAKLREDIAMQRLRDAASVRHQFPIARVSQATALLETKNEELGTHELTN